MMKLQDKIIAILRLFLKPKLLRTLLFSSDNGYLVDTGWVNSFLKNEPVNKFGEPIPWLTYPAVKFISERLNPELTIFEYGSGNSTLFYSKHVKKVVSVEHNRFWYDRIKPRLPKNSEIRLVDIDYNGRYCKSITETGQKFNVVIIDAEDRINCIKNCLDNLTEDGVIILDDSEREEYLEGINFLLQKGFKKIDFSGISGGYMNHKTTTIFYKNINCFNI